jgi:hypothetical protein
MTILVNRHKSDLGCRSTRFIVETKGNKIENMKASRFFKWPCWHVSAVSGVQEPESLENWHQRSPDVGAIWWGVDADYGQGRWVAATEYGRLLLAGRRGWTRTDSFSSWDCAQFGRCLRWVALAGSGSVFTSDNGLDWKASTWGPPAIPYWT